VDDEFVTVHSFWFITFPFPWAFSTVNFWVEWTVLVSKDLFGLESTEPNFTNFNNIISGDITFRNEDSVMFGIEGIFRVDSIINISFIISKDIEGNTFHIITFPSGWADRGFTFTISFWEFWVVEFSPSVFRFNNTIVDFT